MIGRIALWLYATAGHVAKPLVTVMLNWRMRRGKEDAARIGERYGVAGLQRPAGELVWVHAASVGETNAVLPLIDYLHSRSFRVLLTTGTVTSAAIAERRLPESAVHQYIPLDLVPFIEPFLDHWQPRLAIFVESEIWPVIMSRLGRRNIPFVLVNGRMSARSYRGWRRSGPVARAIMRHIALCVAQSANDARRFGNLGVAQVETAGNLKFDVPAPAADDKSVAELRVQIGARPVFVAASTHDGEEAIVCQAHRDLRTEHRGLLTIIVPRHPDRGAAIAADIVATGTVLSQRSAGQRIEHETEIYLADSVGEMGLWYRLGWIVFLGGSLVPHGGQNPIEPAKLGAPIVHGPHISNFADIFAALHDARAVAGVEGADGLTDILDRLLSDEGERKRLAREARACVERQVGALERTIAVIEPLLGNSDGAGDA